MRKSYLFVYANSLGTRDQIKNCVDTIPEIITWRYDMPNCFYIISELDSDAISDAITKCLSNKGRFIISEVTDNKQGILPLKSWHLLNNKRHKQD